MTPLVPLPICSPHGKEGRDKIPPGKVCVRPGVREAAAAAAAAAAAWAPFMSERDRRLVGLVDGSRSDLADGEGDREDDIECVSILLLVFVLLLLIEA